MNWKQVIGSVAPTLATALGGPLAGAAVSAIGNALNLDTPSQATIAKVIEEGKLTPDQLSELKKLELQYQSEEAERGFKFADLEFKDRDSARKWNTEGGIQTNLFVMSCILLCITLGSEIYVLFRGIPQGVSEIIIGRVLGLMDAVAMMVLAYYYGTSHGSAVKTDIMAQK